ncbi:hypothetical protein, partial [Burkholderia lata]|uniref:hypothetical protein n=1 Tax=Burkholderia lata (strain ATCC 17760 / DSM 23089 / LMG 22485 / NCIMB 9086 / R18194 / 383) TaxID=482957 RepID=UPI001C2E139F
LRGTSCFSAALRFQQQRSEIMNRVSQIVNNFFHYIVATAGLKLPGQLSAPDSSTPPTLLPLPRCVSVSVKEA